jgi:mRNA-degrading endonuclease RelE of RelBE toxin-antitoxin system
VAYLVKLTPVAEKQLDRLDPQVNALIRARLRRELLILVLALGRRDEIYS